MEINSKENNQNGNNFFWTASSIWFLNKERPTIAETRIKIVDNEKFEEILDKLKDIDTYISRGFESTEKIPLDFNKNFMSFNTLGATRNLTWAEGNQFSKGRFEYRFSNPKAEAYKLLLGEYGKKTNLLDLFATLEYGDSREKQLLKLKKAENLLRSLKNSKLSKEQINMIINVMWPSFGFFATEALDAISIEVLKSYVLEDLLGDVKDQTELQEVIDSYSLAKTNSKVLRLAYMVKKR